MRIAVLAGLSFLAVLSPLQAEDPATEKGFEHFYNLEYDQAIEIFARSVQGDPENPDRHNHVAQAILFRAMYVSGALESELVTGNNPFLRREKVNPTPDEQQRFEASVGEAMRLAGARLRANPNDAGALYALGVAYGLRSNYNFLVRKAWMDALRDATQARKQHQQLLARDPAFIDAMLIPGVHDYVIGSLPFHYKILGFLAGFRGDREQGIRELETVAARGVQNRYDAKVLLAAIYRRERHSAKAIPLLKELIARYPRNYLFRFELAQMFSDTGRGKDAIAALEEVKRLKLAGTPGFRRLRIEKIAFAKGNIQFWYNDLDAALENMRLATDGSQDLDLNTGVLAWMRLGQLHDLKGRRDDAVSAYRKAIEFAPGSDAARESRRYISRPYTRPNG